MCQNPALSGIPSTSNPAVIEAWAAQQVPMLPNLELEPASFIGVDFAAAASEDDRNRLVNAALLADWACYADDADRADYLRLRAVMGAFPPGFRIFLCRAAWKQARGEKSAQ
jgi:hypothetical protein